MAREFYRRVAAGDVEGVLDLLSDEIVWTVPGATPYSGEFRGREGVAEFFRILLAHEDLQSFAPDEFVVDARFGIACVTGSETAAARQTGRSFSVRWVEAFRIVDGLIVSFEEHIDTLAMARAYDPS